MNSLEVKEFRKKNNLSQNELAELLGVSLTTVRSWEYNQRNPSSSAIKFMQTFKGDSIQGVVDNVVKNNTRNDVKPKKYLTTLEVKIVTMKARAGYADAYYAEEYLADLPTVLIEADREYKGKYLAFEVDGDSMEPDYNKGDIVICREVQRHLWQYKLHFKDYDFVIAHGTKGIMLKEIIDHNVETGEITCHSLNNDDGKHEDFVLNLREVAFLYNVVEHRISGKSKRRNR